MLYKEKRKMIEGLVPNCGLVVKTSNRRGREIEVPKSKGNSKPSGKKIPTQWSQHLQFSAQINKKLQKFKRR